MLRCQGAAKILLIRAAEDGPYLRSWSSDKSANTCQDKASTFKLPYLARMYKISSFALSRKSNGSLAMGPRNTWACTRMAVCRTFMEKYGEAVPMCSSARPEYKYVSNRLFVCSWWEQRPSGLAAVPSLLG